MEENNKKKNVALCKKPIYNECTEREYNEDNNLEDLFEENKKLAYSVFHKYKNEVCMEEEDFLQECFIFLWKAINNYNPSKGELSTFVFRIAKNWVIDEYKREDALKKQVEDEIEIETIVPNFYSQDFLSSLIIEECREEVISRLGENYEQALQYNQLRLQGYSTTQIMSIFNCTENDLNKIRYKIRSLRKKRTDFMI